jgi:hypothetical protein
VLTRAEQLSEDGFVAPPGVQPVDDEAQFTGRAALCRRRGHRRDRFRDPCPSRARRTLLVPQTGQVHEVAQQLLAVPREDRLRVELHPPHRPVAVPQRHQDTVRRPRRALQSVGQVGHGQRVVAHHLERRGYAAKQLVAVVQHRRQTAVAGLRRPDDGRAVRQGHALVSQADTEQREFAALHQFPADPEVGGALRSARAGGQHDGVDLGEPPDVPVRVVIGDDDRLLTGDPGQVVDEVVGERVVVVDQEDAHALSRSSS